MPGRLPSKKIMLANNEIMVDYSGVITCGGVKKEPTIMVENTSKVLPTQAHVSHQYQWNTPGRPLSTKIRAANDGAVID